MRKVITIGTSAGGVDALATIVQTLPGDLDAAVLVVMHVGQHFSTLPALLSRHGRLPVRHATHGDVLRSGVVLVAPPDHHLLVTRVGAVPTVHLSRGPKENHSRPAIDPLFRSAAEHLREQVIGVVLTGYLDDGSAGLHAIKQCGGMAIVQDPNEAYAADMPRNALRAAQVDLTLALGKIGPKLAELVATAAPAQRAPSQVPGWLTMENNYFHQASDMHELQKHAAPSNFTCPDCGGALFQLKDQPYPRYRCHTGHAYSMAALLKQQNEAIESALWMAVRALQEKERLAEQLLIKARGDGDPSAAANYAELAGAARHDARMLRDLANHAAGTLAPRPLEPVDGAK
jgi:two-component system chemotaxis response regulator CheB